MTLPEIRPFLISEILIIGFPFDLVEKADLFKGIFGSGLVIFQ
jgi:hypothetical protein